MDMLQAVPKSVGDGRYEVGKLLRAGQMSRVYRGHDTVEDTPIALKILEGGFGDSVVRQRFLAEIRALTEIQHPRIVQILAAGRDGGVIWYAMEFCPGGSLREVLVYGQSAEPLDAARWTVELLEGLAHAHEAQLIHRDVKPSNLLRDAQGHVKLADFGVARHPREKVGFQTMQGSTVGSGPYQAPELRRSAVDSSIAADIYGAGATLYELLSGKSPVRLGYPGPRERDIGALHPAFREVVDTATDLEPTERYPDALAMRDAVVAAAERWSEASGVPSQAGEWVRKDRGLFARIRAWFGR